MNCLWLGKCPRCGWSIILRWAKEPTLCKRCPGVKLAWQREKWWG